MIYVVLCVVVVVSLGSLMYETNLTKYTDPYFDNNLLSYVHSFIQTCLNLPVLFLANSHVLASPDAIVSYTPGSITWSLVIASHWIFVWYTVLEICFKELSEIYVFHHIFNSIVIIVSVLRGFTFFSVCGLATETSTFFLHQVKLHSFKNWVFNILFVSTFIFLRIIIPVYLVVVSLTHRLFVVMFCLLCNLCLNIHWLNKIVRMKTLYT